MEYRMTRNQVARSARADRETWDTFLLLKNVSELRATYQIRLLVFRAAKEGKKLVVEVPNSCRIHDDLRKLQKAYPRNMRIVRR